MLLTNSPVYINALLKLRQIRDMDMEFQICIIALLNENICFSSLVTFDRSLLVSEINEVCSLVNKDKLDKNSLVCLYKAISFYSTPLLTPDSIKTQLIEKFDFNNDTFDKIVEEEFIKMKNHYDNENKKL